LVTGGRLALNPYAEIASLSIGKARVWNLAGSLSQAMAGKNFFVETVTVNGMVSPNAEIHSPDNTVSINYVNCTAKGLDFEINF
jgi:hypothetical protein